MGFLSYTELPRLIRFVIMADNTRTYTIKLKVDGKEIPNSYSDLQAAQRKVKKELKGLEVGTDAYIKKSQQLNQINKRLDDVRKDINKVGATWKKQQSMWAQAKSTFAGTFTALSVAGAIQGVQQLGREIYAFVKELTKKRQEITRLTDVTGRDLDITAAKIQSIVDTYQKGFDEVLVASNSLAKSMGIEVTEALELMQTGFANGADASGEFLDMLREYPTQFKAAGLTAEQSIAIITQQVKQGIYSDKGVDTIKEGTLRLREMTKATREALEGIGISSSDLEEKLRNNTISYFEALQMVGDRLGDLKEQSPEVGTAIADIFGGPGEDAGLDYIKMLGNVSTELEKVETATSELAEANERLALAYQKAADDDGFLTKWQILFTNFKAWSLETMNLSKAKGALDETRQKMNELAVAAALYGENLEDLKRGQSNILTDQGESVFKNFTTTVDGLAELSKEEITQFLTLLRTAQLQSKNLSDDQIEIIRNLREQFSHQLELLTNPPSTTPGSTKVYNDPTEVSDSKQSDPDFSFITQLKEKSDEAFAGLEELNEALTDQIVDSYDKQVAAQMSATDSAIKHSEQVAAAKEYEIMLNEQIIEQYVMQGMAATENAKSAKQAAAGVLNSIRREIKGIIAKGIAKAIAKEIGEKGILGLATGAIVGGAAGLLFDQLVPSFYYGGPTGSKGMGFGDNQGEYAGYVHKDEYVLSKNMLRDPYVANVTRYIEDSKKFGYSSPSSTGAASAPQNMNVSLDAAEMKEAARIMLDAALVLQNTRLEAKLSRNTYEDAQEDLQQKEIIRARGQLS